MITTGRLPTWACRTFCFLISMWLAAGSATCGQELPAIDLDDIEGDAASQEHAAPALQPSVDASEYYRLYSMLADAIAQVEENYVKPIEREKIFAAAVRGVMRELDPHSSFIEADDFEDFREEVESEFGGLGMQVTLDPIGRLTVISPLVDTPAYRAGIRAGDRIGAINGASTEEMTLSAAVDLLKGPSGTSVKVTIARPGVAEPIELEITRERIHVDTVLGYRRNENNGWDYLLQNDPPIGYVRLTAFSRDTARELRSALTKLKVAGIRGLVVDLRFNPGGLLASAVDIADLFVDEGLIVATDGRNIERKEWSAHARGTWTDVPMAVLVNRFSASASEVVAACLQDHGRAVIVGERTWGKGSVQNVVELEGGQGALKLTTASYHRPSGKNIHRFADATDEDEWGVTPDENFRVRLSLSEIDQLDAEQRMKDIIRMVSEEESDGPPDGDSPSSDTAESETGPPSDESDGAAPFVDPAVGALSGASPGGHLEQSVGCQRGRVARPL